MTTAQQPAIGFWLESDNQKACELARLAGFDLVLFDMEHGILDLAALDRLLPFCQAIGLAACVRLADGTRPNVQHALDIGADAIVVPQLRDLAHAKEVSEYAKFAPRGTRGVGYGRTQSYAGATDSFFEKENTQRLCYAMIETATAFDEAAAIAALPCVDGLFVGPADLSVARRRGAFAATDADLADLRQIAMLASKAGKRWALAGANRRLRETALDLGPAFITVGDDLSALSTGFKSMRSDV
ncbi:aldolase/citrate lyase family protein [Sinorhizobium mexicanum]|uniref:2,4-dihydroxyhept-2-ene-1,7-dioic acid aldolase n=1 Tax=Sinorhizobium mexicanum TaxID=375549 RepID=A0A859QL22_9HYPH|nr:aldolase/citrate lyase family protein [Sinorhizobium mexicanum]MBP1886414.1 2-dehydro-3-deoxyglucarate aldolase/4-hydroxy-2-oxoheptanedioate aldolase [Sinorhizobium mexicanum]QLL63995.1 2,4-dihydroxyhept-2-ene-1,7-dioic acid aldolase [Sinorhizobium mexicanum]